MSNGEQNVGGDAIQVQDNNVPVHTFDFGTDHDPRVLKAIANNSKGGTFSYVQNQDNLNTAFSDCLDGLLAVIVSNLRLTITQGNKESRIKGVSAGNYPQGNITIFFGNVYNKEVRKVIVELLPAVYSSREAEVLKVTNNYGLGGYQLFKAIPLSAVLTRIRTATEEKREEEMIDENRVKTAKVIKEARLVMVDNEKLLEDAKRKLLEAQILPEDHVEINHEPYHPNHPLLDMYEKKGRPFTLSFEASHYRQRSAVRGDDDMEKLHLVATPRMDAYLKQAEEFDC